MVNVKTFFLAQMPTLVTRPLTNVQLKSADDDCRVWEQD